MSNPSLVVIRRGRATLCVSLAVLLFSAIATGCATSSHSTGTPIAQSKVEQIEEGETTVQDVIQMFGQPESQSTMGDKTLYTYKHTKVEGSSAFFPYWSKSESVEKSDELTITFDEDGVVETYHISRGQ